MEAGSSHVQDMHSDPFSQLPRLLETFLLGLGSYSSVPPHTYFLYNDDNNPNDNNLLSCLRTLGYTLLPTMEPGSLQG